MARFRQRRPCRRSQMVQQIVRGAIASNMRAIRIGVLSTVSLATMGTTVTKAERRRIFGHEVREIVERFRKLVERWHGRQQHRAASAQSPCSAVRQERQRSFARAR